MIPKERMNCRGFVTAAVATLVLSHAPATRVFASDAAAADAAAADPAAGDAAGPGAAGPTQRCGQLALYNSRYMSQLAGLSDAPSTITDAKIIPAERDLPEVCQVQGVVAPSIGYVLWMPITTWNGRFMMQGCGGMCGNFFTAQAEEGLVRHYAVVVTDMGHKGNGGMALYGYENLQGQIDFGFRATHVVTLVAKAVIDDFYAKTPERSYFVGCSTGGRQGMVEAERFPEDYDGIIAGAPPWNEMGDLPLFMSWSARANIDADGKNILDAAKLPMIHSAVLTACDKLDGLKDGLLQDPRLCQWDPAQIQCGTGAQHDPSAAGTCLTAAEVGVVRKIYSGATDSHGKALYFGMERGSEYVWTPGFIGADGAPGFNLGGKGSFGSQFVGDLGFFYPVGPTYDIRQFDYDHDPQRLAMTEYIYDAQNPDLRHFRAAGGKLILYHGWDDNEIPPRTTVDYYESATRLLGGEKATKAFFRTFMIPGMNHCRRGPGGDGVDWISYLERWVENDQAPEAVTAYHLKSQQTYSGLPRLRFPLEPALYDRTRPVYAFPDVAKWSGKGDPNDAANWIKAPRTVTPSANP